ncbi:MAG TPA: DUF6350 family protein [Microbacteriaceae bacterium]|nr:DUF6350 family protein [Microbacteriaceae bacterium]
MRRLLSGSLAAIDALALVALGFGVVLIPTLMVWAVQFGFAVDVVGFIRMSANLWLLGHGVDVTVLVDPVLSARLGLDGASAPVRISIALLGIGLLTVQLSIRAGRRAALADDPLISLVAATGVTALLSALLVWLAGSPWTFPGRFQGVLLPTAIVAVSMTASCMFQMWRAGDTRWLDSMAQRLRWHRLDPILRRDLLASIGGGIAIAAALLSAAAVGLAVAIALNYASVVGMYQSLQGGVLGGSIVTVVQLIALPNLVVWAAAWIVGAGFAIGAGTAVAPAGVVLGPIPGLPAFAAVPQPNGPWMLAILLVPVLVAFLTGMFIRQRHDRYSSPARPSVLLTVAAGLAAVSGTILALLSWWAGGAIGPGRMAELGPNPLLVLAWTAGLVGIGALVGGFAGRATATK